MPSIVLPAAMLGILLAGATAFGQQTAPPPASVPSPYHPAPVQPAGYNAPVAVDDGAKLLDAAPDLVHELIADAVTDDSSQEAAFFAVYCLGPKAIPHLVRELSAEDSKRRAVAAFCLAHSCLHEDADRAAAVKGLLAAVRAEESDPENRAALREALYLAVRTTRKNYREKLRATIERELVDGKL